MNACSMDMLSACVCQKVRHRQTSTHELFEHSACVC